MQSLPVVPPQPSEPFYSADSLKLFREYTRASFLAAFGTDAATGISSMRPKPWVDQSVTGAPEDKVTYNVVTIDPHTHMPAITQITMMVKEAQAPNLPGVHSYPPYLITPTDAYTVDAGGNKLAPINALQLALKQEAIDLAVSWGLDQSAVTESKLAGMFAYFYPADEPRRVYEVTYRGTPSNVGECMQEMNENGVGTPGAWDFSGAEPNWISKSPSAPTFVLPAWPTPVRPLLSNEAFAPPQLFAGIIVYRTDETSVYNPAPAAVAAPLGGLTAQQADDIHHTRLGVDAILAALPPQTA